MYKNDFVTQSKFLPAREAGGHPKKSTVISEKFLVEYRARMICMEIRQPKQIWLDSLHSAEENLPPFQDCG